MKLPMADSLPNGYKNKTYCRRVAIAKSGQKQGAMHAHQAQAHEKQTGRN